MIGSKVLIVAEKDSVARAIAAYLSGGKVKVVRVGRVRTYHFTWRGRYCIALGLRGHIMDFDFEEKYNDWLKVRPEVLFNVDPVLVVREENLRYVRVLRYYASKVDTVILALDSDSEGEAISYEVILATYIVNPRLRYYRALFSAVTRKDIERAFNNLTSPRPELAKKVFARMILDLTLGAVFTRVLTLSVRKYLGDKLGSRFLSYGPCQSPVLNLVVQRALERERFKPEKYYTIHIYVRTGTGEVIKLDHVKTYKSKEEALKIAQQVRELGYVKVTLVRNVKVRVSPPKPLDTVELERRLSRFFNIRAKRALDIAEELYRHGYISYPRTETTIYPPTLDLREVLHELLKTEHRDYVRELLAQPKLTPTRGNSDDKAHPPIYPTTGATREEILAKFKRKEFWIVYDFVVRHFLATLSPPARFVRQEIIAKTGPIEFRATGIRILELGYWRIYPFEKVKEILRAAGERGISLRIGVNSGSLESDLIDKYNGPTADALVESAYRWVMKIEDANFYNMKVSIKSSDPRTTIESNEKISELIDYPLHIGVTEAGSSREGIVKSVAALSVLLREGIGDTIRISLSEPPEDEIDVCYELLNSLGLRKKRAIDFVSCPTCGRIEIDLISLVKELKEKLSHIKKPIKVAVMGCVVNAIGESKEADLAIAGGRHFGLIIKKGKRIKKVKEGNLVEEFVKVVEEYAKEI